MCQIEHFLCLFRCKSGKPGTVNTLLANIILNLFLIQQTHACSFHRTYIIVEVLAERFKAIEFVIRHRQVCIPHANISAFGAASPAIIAWTLGNIQGWYFSRYDELTIYFSKGKFCADRRLHLLALLCDCFLKVLRVIDTNNFIILLFINAKQKDTSAILIGKTG